MKKSLCIATGLLLCVAARGQPLFSKMTSYTKQGWEAIDNIFLLGNKQYLIGGALLQEVHDPGFSAVINDTGDIVHHQVTLPDTFEYFTSQAMDYDLVSGRSYYFGMTTTNSFKAAVVSNSPSFQDYSDTLPGSAVFYAGHVHKNNIIGGGGLHKGDFSGPFLVAVDSFGNERWRSYFQVEGLVNSGTFQGIEKLTDTSFVAVGFAWYYKFDQNSTFTFRPVIAAFTYSGRLLWQKTEGHHKFIWLKDVVAEEDGSLVVCGQLGTPQTYPGTSRYTNDPYWQGLVYKLDPEGNLVWEVVMPEPPSPSNTINRVIKLKSGDYLAVGVYSLRHSDTFDGAIGGSVVKIDPNGKWKWYRRYEHIRLLRHVLEDVVEREDGGFIAVGHITANIIGDIDPPQQMWLLGLDENGCLDPADCPNWAPKDTLGIVGGIVKEAKLKIHPNPASSEIFISLPETFGGGHCQLAIYDMQGRLAGQQTVIATPGQPISYSTAHLPNGLYMVRIGMGEKTAGGRLVVVK